MSESILERLLRASNKLLQFRYSDGECDAVTLHTFSSEVKERELYGDIIDKCEHKRIVIQEEDGTFQARRGCLDCDKWLDPVRFIIKREEDPVL